MTSSRRPLDGIRRRRSSAKVVAWWLLAMAVMLVLAAAEAIVAHTVVLILLAAAAVAAAYGLGRMHGARRMAARTIAAELRLDAVRRSGAERDRLASELERLANRSLDEIVGSYHKIQGQYRRQP